MQVSVESGEGLHRRIHVELPSAEVEREIEAKLKELARTVRIHGFRPGKVPIQIVRQRFLGEVRDEVLNEKVKTSWAEAVKQVGLVLASAPEIESQVDFETARYGYIARVEVIPEITLADFSDAIIERPLVTTTEADYANMIQKIQQQFSTWQVVARPATTNDQVRMTLSARIEGDEQNSHPPREILAIIGADGMIEGFEAGLRDLSAGESRTLDLPIPGNHPVASLRGRTIYYDIQVMDVSERVLPAVDAAFAKRFGVEDGDVARLEQEVRANTARELAQRVRNKVHNQVMEVLLKYHPFNVPISLIRGEIHKLREQFQQEPANQGKAPQPDTFFEAAAERRVRLGLLFMKIASRYDIKATPSLIRTYIENLAASYENPQEVVQHHYNTPKLLQSIEGLVLENLVVEWALDHLQVREVSMSFDHALEINPSMTNP
ncbi:MAG: trigger factor [Pseudomonadota bacterium]